MVKRRVYVPAAIHQTDHPWDIMSGPGCASTSTDSCYGMSGPGMNAWNMRAMGGLDETRILKINPHQGVSQTIVLNPLHRRTQPGYLGAELPGIGGHSPYLVEFRVPTLWDAAIGLPVVIVHRYLSPNSYIMKGTKGQKALQAGDTFLIGTGPFSKVTVRSIDAVNETATIDLCYSLLAPRRPDVEIKYISNELSLCAPQVPVEKTVAKFVVDLVGGTCITGYQLFWGVVGATAAPGQHNPSSSFSVLLGSASQEVTITVEAILDDGTILSAHYSFYPLGASLSTLQQILCLASVEHLRPIPWWEWSPEKIIEGIGRSHSAEDWKALGEIGKKISQLADQIAKGKK